MYQLDSALGRSVAMRRIDDRKSADLNSTFSCDFLDPGRRADQDRLYDAELGGVGGATERVVVARMHNNRLCRRDRLRPGNQAFVFGFRRVIGSAYGLQGTYFALALSCSCHAGSISLQRRRAKRLSCPLHPRRLLTHFAQPSVDLLFQTDE